MEKMRGIRPMQKKRGRIRMRAVLSICLLLSVCLLVLAVVGSYWVTSVVSGYAVENYQANASSVARIFDREIEHIETIATQLSRTEWVRRIMFMQGDAIDRSRVSDYSLYEHQQQMRTFKQTNSLISEIGVLFFDKNLVIASYGKSDFRFLAENAIAVEGMNTEAWQGLAQQLSFQSAFQLDDVTVRKYGVAHQSALLVYPLQDGSTWRVQAALFVVLHHQDVERFLAPNLLATGAQDALLQVRGQEMQKPFLQIGSEFEGNTQKLSAASTRTGWQFSIEIPQSIVLTGATGVRNILLLVVLVMWAISLLAAFFITRKFFFPFERIAYTFAGEDEARRFIDEYDAIQKGIEQLHMERTALQKELVHRQPMARAACMQSLLMREEMSDEERRKIIGTLDIGGTQSTYCVCMLLTMYERQAQMPDLQTLENACLALLEQPEDRAVVSYHGSTPTVLLCLNDRAALQRWVVGMLERFADVYIILGETVDRVDRIAHAMKTTLIARDYRIVSEGFRVQRYDVALPSKGGYYLPQDIEYRLLQAIRNGNAQLALEVFDMLYTHNATQHETTHASLRNLLVNIHLDVIKLQQANQLPEHAGAQWHEGNAQEMVDDVRAQIEHTAAIYRAYIQSTPAQLEDILSYVQANLHDSALSLTMLADAFGLSNSLVSRLFSEQLGENFLAYVNRLRIEFACDCIKRNPRMDILSVAKAAGYDNDVTFRRLFKKHVGLTPSQYRVTQADHPDRGSS